MYDLEELKELLVRQGLDASVFQTAAEAADYLDSQIDGRTVAFGGSKTAQEMGLPDRLETHNKLIWHRRGYTLQDEASTDVYICSVNGVAMTGELINIDGTGNRVSSTLFGHQTVYLVVGCNKIADDFEGALWRARNIAAPKNAQRLHAHTPCAVNGDRCYNCSGPNRICKTINVLYGKPYGVKKMEVVLVNEPLGY